MYACALLCHSGKLFKLAYSAAYKHPPSPPGNNTQRFLKEQNKYEVEFLCSLCVSIPHIV